MLRLIRHEETEQGAISVLKVDGAVHSWALEPDSADPTKGHIPGGTPDNPKVYKVKRFHGYKWKDTFEIIVPGHTAVLIHPGNTEKDTLLCVILGATIGKLKGERAVLNSGQSFRLFMEKMKDRDEDEIEVIDFL